MKNKVVDNFNKVKIGSYFAYFEINFQVSSKYASSFLMQKISGDTFFNISLGDFHKIPLKVEKHNFFYLELELEEISEAYYVESLSFSYYIKLDISEIGF